MSKSIKVGVFVLGGLLLLGIAVFMIGENRNLWDPKTKYQAAFFDVAGLKPGAPIRMGGVDIGTVTGVGHGEAVEDTRVYVTMSVTKKESVRVREDTIARVVNRGLLGDKMIELSSDGKGPELAYGKMLKTEEPIDFGKYVAKFEEIANKASKAVDNIEQGTRPLADPQFAEDLKTTLHNLRAVTDGLVRSDSVLHRLIMDPHEGEKFDAVLTNMQLATGDLHDMTTHLRSGPGLAHALVYDAQMTTDVAGSLAEVNKDLRQIREGNGLVHTLVYGDSDTQHLMTNVNAMSDDLREVVHGLKTGKGTLGALLVDPSVYEDIKGLVGNVERNQVLRALVRYSIKADETRPPPKVEPASK
jgi:phospholipid/cholesterol/gamma-HCH transport system substrate-binding protein